MSRNDRRAEHGERPSVQLRRLPAVAPPAPNGAERGERHGELGMVGPEVAFLDSECGAGVVFGDGQVIPGERDRRQVAVDDPDLVVVLTKVLHEDMAGGVQELARLSELPGIDEQAGEGAPVAGQTHGVAERSALPHRAPGPRDASGVVASGVGRGRRGCDR